MLRSVLIVKTDALVINVDSTLRHELSENILAKLVQAEDVL